ncbi:MAG: phosphatidate cytidylyltransferase [Flavobacteriales bacterium]|nr:phosphatidate cytidylyltransferase [Flavobacteriales bacterium]
MKSFDLDLPMKLDLVPRELQFIILIIYGVLTLSSLAFWILNKTKSKPLYEELVVRTRSWWYLATGVVVLITAPKIVGTILVGFVSFVALRELFSIARFREADRTALVVAYLAIPIQYYLAYNMYYPQFLYFIPLIMFIALPFILVLTGNTSKVGRSMSMIPTVLLLTVYMLSHIVLLFNIEVPGFTLGSGGLIIFLIMLTSFNDVFQFFWGKLFGRHKILPTVSPNKTWEGFIGGILTTALLGYL